jgi:hypothetical protein
VETRKDALIVTDGTAAVQDLAREIAAELGDFKVLVKAASGFAGTDILPAGVFFLGCEQPDPPSFAGIAELLRHINLAGRSCGVFSPGSGAAAAYLAGLVTDCEAALGEPFVAAENKAGLKNWVKSILP